jgi:CDP-paratose 2-epimerase
MVRAWSHIDALRGRAYNLGGGPRHTLSLLELIDLIEQLRGRRLEEHFEPWREHDRRYYVSDIRAFAGVTGWSPKVAPQAGVAALLGWVADRDTVLRGVV